MPTTIEAAVLAVAVVLMLAGLVGLLPSIVPLQRRRRLISQLAGLRVEQKLLSKDATSGGPSAGERRPAHVRPTSAPRPALEAVVSAPSGNGTVSVPVLGAEREAHPALLEVRASADVSKPEDEGDTRGDAGSDDDLQTPFRETGASSSTSAATSDTFEPVGAADLLAQARELRELLRRSA